MAYTGGIDRTAVILGKSGEIIIDDRLVAVASCDGRLQIVGNYCRRSSFGITIPQGKPSNLSGYFYLPALGRYSNSGTLQDVGNLGYYWLSTSNPWSTSSAYNLNFHSSYVLINNENRYNGFQLWSAQ